MDLRDRVELLLTKQGKQKKDLAKYLNISQGNLNRTLMGTSAERENKIAEFFNITRDELMINDYSTERVADNENEDNLKQLIRNNTILVETNQRLVERILILTDKKTESDTAEVV